MGDPLASHQAVVQSHCKPRSSQSLRQSPSHEYSYGEKTTSLSLGKLGEALHMRAGDDQSMTRGHGGSVQKGKNLFILVKEMSRKFASCDAAKRAIHRTSLANLLLPTLRIMPFFTLTRS